MLDKGVATVHWLDKFPMARLYHCTSSVSDHCPLSLHLKERKKTQCVGRSFHFEAMWLKEASCEEVVTSAWEEATINGSDFPMVECLNNCRMKLEDWNKNVFGHVGNNLARLQKQLQWLELQSATPEVIASLRETRVELNCWRDKAEAMWHQRSRLSWLQSGDKNTGFFHSKASSRFQKNFIEGLLDSNDRWVEDQRDVENVVLNYYSELFKSANPTEFAEILSSVHPKVSTTMNERLTRDFQENEVCKALKQMYPLKASGPDEMPPLFFQHFWPTVGRVVTKTVLDFLNSSVCPPNFNDTQIVLIPKIKNLFRITDYRPISLCIVVYKLASKTLVNRLKFYLLLLGIVRVPLFMVDSSLIIS